MATLYKVKDYTFDDDIFERLTFRVRVLTIRPESRVLRNRGKSFLMKL